MWAACGVAAVLALAACRRAAPPIDEAPAAHESSPVASPPSTAQQVASPARDATEVDPGVSAVAASDACPGAQETINGYLDGDGCPDELPADLAAITGVIDGLVFDFDKDTIKVASFPVLQRIAAVLQRYPDVKIEIRGHEDARSAEHRYSRCLTCNRARAVENYLVHTGIERPRLRSKGFGDSMPIDTNRTEAGRRRNRRVEILLLDPAGAPLSATPPTGVAGCVDRRTVRRADGSTESCYPYACRAGACLRRCAAMTDCGGAHHPGELQAEGWPLECMPSGECTPMPPEKVR